MATGIFEGFSISHAAILDGTTGAQLVNGDIYGVNQGTVELDTADYQNNGDDVVLSVWDWFNFATITVQGGYVPFSLIATLTNTVVTSSGTAPNDYYSLPLWSIGSLNTTPKPMLIRVPSRDSAGVVRTMEFVLFRVQFGPMSFDGPTFKDGLKLNYHGRAVVSSVDEKGTALVDPAIGRLVNRW
jgi:hypothetical protein